MILEYQWFNKILSLPHIDMCFLSQGIVQAFLIIFKGYHVLEYLQVPNLTVWLYYVHIFQTYDQALVV